ncbi:MAG: outer membrane lipoprotein-sorting protein [Spirochaetales bacterium]
MKRRHISISMLVALALVAIPITAQTPDFGAILATLDERTTFGDGDFSAVYTIISETPGEEREVTQARLFRRDQNDQFLILILQPEVQRGQGYLQIDDNVWFYDPESRKFERTTIRENIQGSDAQNADLDENTYSEDYEVVDWELGRLGNFDVYVMDLQATNSDVAYERIKLWVRQDDPIVLKQEDYSVSGRLMRTSRFPRYQQVEDKLLPKQILINDELNQGERTQITMSDATTQQIPDSVFTKRYLERVSN